MKVKEVAGDFSMSGTRRMQAPGNIRAGFMTVGSRSSLQDDLAAAEQQEKQDRTEAAIVYVQSGNKILAVSRGQDLTNMNMPGGGLEPGETPEDAAIRELWEETGVRATEIHPIFTKDMGGRRIHFFKATKFQGKLRSSEEGVAEWVDPSTLLRGQYADSFLEVISRM